MTEKEINQIYELTLWGMGKNATTKNNPEAVEKLIWRLTEIRRITGKVT